MPNWFCTLLMVNGQYMCWKLKRRPPLHHICHGATFLSWLNVIDVSFKSPIKYVPLANCIKYTNLDNNLQLRLKYLRLVDGQDGVLKNQIKDKEAIEIKEKYRFLRDAREHIDLQILVDCFPFIPEFRNIYKYCWIMFCQLQISNCSVSNYPKMYKYPYIVPFLFYTRVKI